MTVRNNKSAVGVQLDEHTVMRPHQSLFVLTILSVGSAFGQTPDFTGTWKQIGVSDRTRIETIEQQDAFLKVAAESTSGPGGLFTKDEFRTGGTESYRRTANRQQWTTVIWQGPALIFLTVSKDGNGVTATRESWTQSDSGKTLTKVIRIVREDGVTQKTLVFQRQ